MLDSLNALYRAARRSKTLINLHDEVSDGT